MEFYYSLLRLWQTIKDEVFFNGEVPSNNTTQTNQKTSKPADFKDKFCSLPVQVSLLVVQGSTKMKTNDKSLIIC